MQSHKVLILTQGDDCAALSRLPLAEHEVVVLVFWCSPEFVARIKASGARECWRLNDIVTNYAGLVTAAYALARGVVTRVPSYRGVNPLQPWENTIANALLVPKVMSVVHEFLAARYDRALQITFVSDSDGRRAFEIINQLCRDPFQLRVLPGVGPAVGRRGRRRLKALLDLARETRRDGDWRQVIWEPIQAWDRDYTWRRRLSRRPEHKRGGALLYSSYENYSRSLARQAARVDPPIHWIINCYSARRGLPKGKPWTNLWQFDSSPASPHPEILGEAYRALERLPEQVDGFPLRAVCVSSDWIRRVLRESLPQVLAELDLMSACLEEIRPDSVWVANQWGSEGGLVQLAREKHIPVVQVQHGNLEQNYACAPIYSDRFLVWGEFWRRMVPASERSKVEIVNPGFEIGGVARNDEREKTRITFFTTPAAVSTFWNPSVYLWETVMLANDLAKQTNSILVRVHPADRIQLYAEAWRRYHGRLPGEVDFDKDSPLGQILAKTDIALMSFSTVFLNCLASGIPVRGLGWYEFMQKEQIEASGYIRYADSLAELLDLVRESLPADMPQDKLRQVLAAGPF